MAPRRRGPRPRHHRRRARHHRAEHRPARDPCPGRAPRAVRAAQVHDRDASACHSATLRLGGYVARALPDRDTVRVRRHLDRCEAVPHTPRRDRRPRPRLKDLVPALPIAIEALADRGVARPGAEGAGPLGLHLPSGRPAPAWAERALAGATAAVVSIGITAAVLLGGEDGPGTRPIESAGAPPDGEQALPSAPGPRSPVRRRHHHGHAPLCPCDAPAGTSTPSSTAAGATAAPTAGETPRGSARRPTGASSTDPPTTPRTPPTAPPTTPEPTTPPPATPSPDPEATPIDDVVSVVEDVVDGVCEGLAPAAVQRLRGSAPGGPRL